MEAASQQIDDVDVSRIALNFLRLKARIHEREVLLGYEGVREFSYIIKKNLGYESRRTLILDFENQLMIFPNAKKVNSTVSVSSVISVVTGDIEGCLIVSLRLTDGNTHILKEKEWHFKPPECAQEFRTLINCMNSNGPKLRTWFSALLQDDKRFVDESDIQAALIETNLNINSYYPFLAQRMVSEADPAKSGRVRFADFFVVLMFSDVESLRECLEDWAQIAEDRMEMLDFSRASLPRAISGERVVIAIYGIVNVSKWRTLPTSQSRARSLLHNLQPMSIPIQTSTPHLIQILKIRLLQVARAMLMVQILLLLPLKVQRLTIQIAYL